MKFLFAITSIMLFACLGNRAGVKTDVTGEYFLGDSLDKEGIKPGGVIHVLQIVDNQIVLSLDYCKGAPSFNLGSFMDTLQLENNQAIYRSEYDSTCTIHFTFIPKGLNVNQQSTNWPAFCGFGWGVDATGFYTKTSKIITEVKDPFEGL
jgi:hypothetical protein